MVAPHSRRSAEPPTIDEALDRLEARLLAKLAGIDVLLCEGTHIRADDGGEGESGVEEPARSEAAVELSLTQRMLDTEGVVTVISSAQNIDRLVTVYRACLRAGRTLVTDLYTASILAAIGRETIPQPGFPSYKVYVPNWQRVQVKTAGEFDRMRLLQGCRVFPEWLAGHAGEITLLQPSSAVTELLRAGVLANGTVVWSMWPGYLKDLNGRRLVGSLELAGLPFVLDHSSGHASVKDLQRLVAGLSPRKVVPVHTEGADRYRELFPSVCRWKDGDWWGL